MLMLLHVYSASTKTDAVALQTKALLVGHFTIQLDLPSRADDALPWQAFGHSEHTRYLAGIHRISGGCGHLRVSGYLALGNTANRPPHDIIPRRRFIKLSELQDGAAVDSGRKAHGLIIGLTAKQIAVSAGVSQRECGRPRQSETPGAQSLLLAGSRPFYRRTALADRVVQPWIGCHRRSDPRRLLLQSVMRSVPDKGPGVIHFHSSTPSPY